MGESETSTTELRDPLASHIAHTTLAAWRTVVRLSLFIARCCAWLHAGLYVLVGLAVSIDGDPGSLEFQLWIERVGVLGFASLVLLYPRGMRNE